MLWRYGGRRKKLIWKPHAPAASTPTACVRGGAAVKLGKKVRYPMRLGKGHPWYRPDGM